MTDPVSITTKRYFEGPMFYAGWVLILLGLFVIPVSLIATFTMVFLGTIFITTRYKLDVDTKNKKIYDYLLLLWFKLNIKQFGYEKLEYIFYGGHRYSQQLNYKSLSTQVHGKMHTAYLVADDQKHFLGESKNAETLYSRIGKISRQLGVQIKS